MGLLTDEYPCANFFDLDTLKDDVESLKEAFSGIPNVMHAYALKANPVAGILD